MDVSHKVELIALYYENHCFKVIVLKGVHMYTYIQASWLLLLKRVMWQETLKCLFKVTKQIIARMSAQEAVYTACIIEA